MYSRKEVSAHSATAQQSLSRDIFNEKILPLDKLIINKKVYLLCGKCTISFLDLLSSALIARFASSTYVAPPPPVACASRLGPEAFANRPAFDEHTRVLAFSSAR